MTIRERIEAKAGRPLERVLEDYARAGLPRRRLAADYGERLDTLRSYLYRHGISGRLSYREVHRRSRLRWQGGGYGIVCTIRGVTRWRTLGEIADETGMPYSTLRRRWHQGKTSEEELLQASGEGRHQPYYEIGWSERRWREALDAAETLINRSRAGSPKAAAESAARTLGIPLGALRAAQRGEWHRIG